MFTDVVLPLGVVFIIFGFVFGPRLIRAWSEAFGPGAVRASSAVQAELEALRAEIASLKAERGTASANGSLKQELADLRAAYLEKILSLERRVKELEAGRPDESVPGQQRPTADREAGLEAAPPRVMGERDDG